MVPDRSSLVHSRQEISHDGRQMEELAHPCGLGLAGLEQCILAISLNGGGTKETLKRLLFSDSLGHNRHCVTASLHAFAVLHLSLPQAQVAQPSHAPCLLNPGVCRKETT